MPRKDRSTPRRARVRLLGVLVLATLASGCGGVKAGGGSPPSSRLASPAGATQLAEVALVQRAARTFARTYVRSTNDPTHPATSGASAALAAQLRANPTRLRGVTGLPTLRLRAVAVSIHAPNHAAATMTLAAETGPPYAVTFLLARRSGRWLAIGIDGTGASG